MNDEVLMINIHNHEQRHTLMLVIWIVAFIVSAFMALGGIKLWGQNRYDHDGQNIAVLQSNQAAINSHLVNTDRNVSRITDKVDALQSQVSLMEGEEYAAWVFLSLLCGTGVFIQVKTRKG